MTEPHQARSVGETGGLPGANADPRTELLSSDELADTVSGLGPAGGDSADGPEGDTEDDASTRPSAG